MRKRKKVKHKPEINSAASFQPGEVSVKAVPPIPKPLRPYRSTPVPPVKHPLRSPTPNRRGR